jgi:ribonuclease HI
MDASLIEEYETVNAPVEVEVFNKSDYDHIVFTDGSSVNTPVKKSGSGVYFYKTNLKVLESQSESDLLVYSMTNEITYAGKLKDYTGLCNDHSCTKIGYSESGKCSEHKSPNERSKLNYHIYQTTNIRAEGLAILLAIQAMINIKMKKKVTERDSIVGVRLNTLKAPKFTPAEEKMVIVTDSKFWIDVMTSWLPGWISKRTLMTRKNIDIIVRLIKAVESLEEVGVSLTFWHTRGHQTDDSFETKGNNLADKLATTASASKSVGIFAIN